mmetsp:Transcript_94254/g.203696  ORF Transcript_94254/g.203696 Transcript_94254/m.203696 type:complete len:82 (+) Transcript_94254:514-759(+)
MTVGMGATGVAGSFSASLVLDRFGRKLQLLGATGLMSVAMLVVVVCQYSQWDSAGANVFLGLMTLVQRLAFEWGFGAIVCG